MFFVFFSGEKDMTILGDFNLGPEEEGKMRKLV